MQEQMQRLSFVVFLAVGVFYSLSGTPKQIPEKPVVVLDQQQICSEPGMCRSSAALTEIQKAIATRERPLRVATYNVHKCTGMDARRNVDRIADAILSLDADIISLQEVLTDSGNVPSAQVRYLALKTGMYAAVAAPTKRKKDGLYGNALLSRFPIAEARLHDISVGDFEPRGIIDADIVIGNRTVRVVATHFGLFSSEGSLQAARLLQILEKDSRFPLIVMGDMNSWMPGSERIRLLRNRLGDPVSMPSFPASFAVLSLDKIWVLSDGIDVSGGVHRTDLTRIASDHLPLVTSIYLR
jgi:endonuclease/exonuclease/phosphatase family metal-dependent hydrolase